MSQASHRVVVLGAGRSVSGGLPSAMATIDGNQRLIDWLRASFAVLPAPELYFVVGYKADAVESLYPDVRFFFNPRWAETGPAASLALVPLAAATATYVAYADVVFRPEAVRQMEAVEAELVLAIDSRWQVRYESRSRADMDAAEKVVVKDGRIVNVGRRVATDAATAEFAGLFRVSGRAAEELREILRSELPAGAGVPELLRRLLDRGVRAAVLDVRGDWAELDAPQDLARFVLGTKAESLERLRPLLRHGHIGPQVSFTHRDWREARQRWLDEIGRAFAGNAVIVRSSALAEDGWLSSAAGAYKSLLDVPSNDTHRLADAVDEVFASYGEEDDGNQILVQEMLRNVAMSGVVMTRTPTLGAPYYVVNFDDVSARTDTVTSGEGGSLRTLFLHRGDALRPGLPPQLDTLMEILAELEQLVGHDSLDVEFAFTRDGVGHVLQVRPIAVAHHDQPIDDQAVARGLENAERFVRELARPAPLLVGGTTLLSVMADWNPAEMVGTKPSRLAFSLYRYLITDESWARQRAEYGYRDVRPHPLIVDVLGHPYVDVRVDFNSFIPAKLDDEIAARLADHYLERLKRAPELHDKVEFDILVTCYDFDFDARAAELRGAGFGAGDVERLRHALEEITRRGIARCAGDLEALATFERRFEVLAAAELEPLERAHLCLEDARRIGVPVFSHLARNAFVAVAMLRSLESRGVLTVAEREAFLGSIRSVASDLKADARRVGRGEMGWKEFVAAYGHLRPGSYDITSPCYASSPEEYLRPMLEASIRDGEEEPAEPWSAATRRAVDSELERLDLGVDVDGLERFLRQAIEGRELGKFTFMKNVNAALEALAELGRRHGLEREQLAHLRIGELLELRGARGEDVGLHLRTRARLGKEAWYVTQAVCLPGQVFSVEDVRCFEQRKAEPNFVTREKVRAEVASLAGQLSPADDLAGKIVLIPNADPGFDWLFAREIAGLITMYGGVNSHMAIRAAELRLPAAIGIGDLLYEKISTAARLELDCASRQLKILH